MAVNKVEYGDTTLIDLTSDTVTKETLLIGATAHTASGESISGEFDPEIYLRKSGGDTTNNIVTFTSGDSTSPTAWTDVNSLVTGEKHSSLLNKISTMIKNVRFLYKVLGTTDISTIGDGTVTGAVSTLNSSLMPKNIFSASFVKLNDYITEEWKTFAAPYSGWYWLYCSTGNQSEINCFVRLGIINGYMYSENGQKGRYNYVTSPLIYIKKGEEMIAQTSSGLKISSILYCHIDE